MGNPSTTPQEAAPAYDDVFGDHPVNRFTSSGSTSAYAAVTQHDDDVELQAHVHDHSQTSPSHTPEPADPPESLVQTLAGVFKSKPHVHCEQCDVQMAARQRRENEKHCCTMVALTFIVGFLCMFIFGTMAVGIFYKRRP